MITNTARPKALARGVHGKTSWWLLVALVVAVAAGLGAWLISSGRLQRHTGLSRVVGQLAGMTGLADAGMYDLSDERGTLQATLVQGLVTAVIWKGELLQDSRVFMNEELLTVLDENGAVLREVPLGADGNARWLAASLEGRLGFAVDVPTNPAARGSRVAVAITGGLDTIPADPPRVTFVTRAGPAHRADLRVGDELVGLFGQPVALADMLLAQLDGALAQRLGGGEIALLVRRDGTVLPVRIALDPLAGPELLASLPADDPVTAFVAAQRRARQAAPGGADGVANGETARDEAARAAQERADQRALELVPVALQAALADRARQALSEAGVLADPVLRTRVLELLAAAARRAEGELDRSVTLESDETGSRAIVELTPAQVHEELLRGLDFERHRRGVDLSRLDQEHVDAALALAAADLARVELPITP